MIGKDQRKKRFGRLKKNGEKFVCTSTSYPVHVEFCRNVLEVAFPLYCMRQYLQFSHESRERHRDSPITHSHPKQKEPFHKHLLSKDTNSSLYSKP